VIGFAKSENRKTDRQLIKLHRPIITPPSGRLFFDVLSYNHFTPSGFKVRCWSSEFR